MTKRHVSFYSRRWFDVARHSNDRCPKSSRGRSSTTGGPKRPSGCLSARRPRINSHVSTPMCASSSNRVELARITFWRSVNLINHLSLKDSSSLHAHAESFACLSPIGDACLHVREAVARSSDSLATRSMRNRHSYCLAVFVNECALLALPRISLVSFV